MKRYFNTLQLPWQAAAAALALTGGHAAAQDTAPPQSESQNNAPAQPETGLQACTPEQQQSNPQACLTEEQLNNMPVEDVVQPEYIPLTGDRQAAVTFMVLGMEVQGDTLTIGRRLGIFGTYEVYDFGLCGDRCIRGIGATTLAVFGGGQVNAYGTGYDAGHLGVQALVNLLPDNSHVRLRAGLNAGLAIERGEQIDSTHHYTYINPHLDGVGTLEFMLGPIFRVGLDVYVTPSITSEPDRPPLSINVGLKLGFRCGN